MNIHDFYKEELAKKKTISSKKAFLTKSQKAVSEHLKDLNDHKAGGWLFGERVTHFRIFKVKTELKVIENLKKALEKTGLKGVSKKTSSKPKKSVACSKVLQLMDEDYSYQKALREVLKKNKRLDKAKLEAELDNYI